MSTATEKMGLGIKPPAGWTLYRDGEDATVCKVTGRRETRDPVTITRRSGGDRWYLEILVRYPGGGPVMTGWLEFPDVTSAAKYVDGEQYKAAFPGCQVELTPFGR